MTAHTAEQWRELRREATRRLTSFEVERSDGRVVYLTKSDPKFGEFHDEMVALLAEDAGGYAYSRLASNLRTYLRRKVRQPTVTDQQILDVEQKYATRKEQAEALGIEVRTIQKRKKAMLKKR